MPEQVALHVVTLRVSQPLELFFLLDTFRDDLRANAMRERDHGLDQVLVLLLHANAVNETVIELEQIDWELLQVRQGRVARAEVIERDDRAGVTQLFENPGRHFGIAHRRALGDLQHQTLRIEVMRLDAALGIRRQITVVQ